MRNPFVEALETNRRNKARKTVKQEGFTPKGEAVLLTAALSEVSHELFQVIAGSKSLADLSRATDAYEGMRLLMETCIRTFPDSLAKENLCKQLKLSDGAFRTAWKLGADKAMTIEEYVHGKEEEHG